MNYDEVYKQYHEKIFKYLSSFVGASEAEDLTQEVFIKVANKLQKLKDPAKLSAWIFKIALNSARDRFRRPSIMKSAGGRRSSASAAATEDESMDQIPDTQSRTPEEGLVRNEMIQCYVEFVKKLPKHYCDVYVLSEFEELSDKAISKRLSLPLETVKIRLHRARARLYDELRTHCRCYCNERGELMGDRK